MNVGYTLSLSGLIQNLKTLILALIVGKQSV